MESETSRLESNKDSGIDCVATKTSLELKKRYLLGETQSSNISKSASASALDSKFKTFHSSITECQKLLNRTSQVEEQDNSFDKKLNKTVIQCHQHPLAQSMDSKIRNYFPETNVKVIPDILATCKQTNDFHLNQVVSEMEPDSLITIINNAQDQTVEADSIIESVQLLQEIQETCVPDTKNSKEKEENLLSNPQSENSSINVSANDFKFDLKNTNKVDSLRQLPINSPESIISFEQLHSGSEAAPALTETELSDWTADDVVSETFINKGTDKSHTQNKKIVTTKEQKSTPTPLSNEQHSKHSSIEGIEFIDSGIDTNVVNYNRNNTYNRPFVSPPLPPPKQPDNYKEPTKLSTSFPAYNKKIVFDRPIKIADSPSMESFDKDSLVHVYPTTPNVLLADTSKENIIEEPSKPYISNSITAKKEQLTKERLKQKDIIYELVMNRLQQKKKLNESKRLNETYVPNKIIKDEKQGFERSNIPVTYSFSYGDMLTHFHKSTSAQENKPSSSNEQKRNNYLKEDPKLKLLKRNNTFSSESNLASGPPPGEAKRNELSRSMSQVLQVEEKTKINENIKREGVSIALKTILYRVYTTSVHWVYVMCTSGYVATITSHHLFYTDFYSFKGFNQQ